MCVCVSKFFENKFLYDLLSVNLWLLFYTHIYLEHIKFSQAERVYEPNRVTIVYNSLWYNLQEFEGSQHIDDRYLRKWNWLDNYILCASILKLLYHTPWVHKIWYVN